MDFLYSQTEPAAFVEDFQSAPDYARPLISHIALIGNYLPRRCGIATFTTDIHRAFLSRYPTVKMDVWAMNDGAANYAYPSGVTGSIEQDDPMAYKRAAAEILASGADLVWIQHEFGIFGGEAGEHILKLIDRLAMPVAVTLHTVLSDPTPAQRHVIDALVECCDILIVMADTAKRILIETYKCDPAKIGVIAHGIPDRPFVPTAPMKARLGWNGRQVILTFGLLSPGKGIETMIAAMPQVVSRVPEALYVILGATHPHCLAHEGEAYREQLQAMADNLGIGPHVQWIDGFCDIEDLLDYLAAADIYVTPYLNPAQVTSGTLAYAVGLGKPVVSTPYVHASELLGGGIGQLVDFGDSDGFAHAIIDLLEDEVGLMDIRNRAYALGRHMIWPRLADAAMTRFEQLLRLSGSKALDNRSHVAPDAVAVSRSSWSQ